MALVSPGVEITITDESQYLPTGVGTIPLVVVATAENKTINGLIASGTTKSNAGKAYGISSQRELATTFGLPTFRRSSGDTPLHGDELNEFGLMAAYSALGLGNRAWVVRADVDLDQLEGTTTRPSGTTITGTNWLDVGTSTFGVYEFDSTIATPAVPFVSQSIDHIITDSAYVSAGAPLDSIGSKDDYAVVSTNTVNALFKKLSNNTWAKVGSQAWVDDIPITTGTVSNASVGTTSFTGNLLINGVPINFSSTVGLHGVSSAISSALTGTGITVSLTTAGYLQFKGNASVANLIIANGTTPIAANIGLEPRTHQRATVAHASYINQPDWRYVSGGTNTPRPSGSVWIKTSAEGAGANLVFKRYNATTATWVTQSAKLFANGYEALATLDVLGGGLNVTAGSTFVRYLPRNDGTVGYEVYQARTAGAMSIVGEKTTVSIGAGAQFSMQVSVPGTATPTVSSTYTFAASANASSFVTAVQSLGMPNVTASVESTGAVRISHSKGGIVALVSPTSNVIAEAGFVAGNVAGVSNYLTSGAVSLSNWDVSTYTVSISTPTSAPVDGQLWYYNDPTVVDVMINDGTNWKGYANVSVDARGYNLSLTDPNGVIVSASEPILQSDNTALVSGDLWLDTSDLENFPKLYRYDGATLKWTLIDNTDRISQNGILFADARWSSNKLLNPVSGTMTAPASMLTSDVVDEDCPDARLYPRGMLLFNTRRSGYNVKKYIVNYFNPVSFPTVTTTRSAWVTQLGFKTSGAPMMGHHAQRNEIVQSMKAAVDSNLDLREEGYNFNLLTAPGYPELIPNLVALNSDRANTGFIIGDTPMTLVSTINAINAHSTSVVTSSEYLGLYYPSALTTDLSGNEIAVPASHMMLRTFLYNDNISYQWFAPAGTRRGLIDNALAIGYIDTTTGNFIRTGISNQLRDALYETRINPITLLNGVGIVAYGQKTRSPVTAGVGGSLGASSAMDRINVARLVNYLRTVLTGVSNQFLFEPNDKITRDQIKQLIESVMNDLIAKRGLYDYLVVCDETNNTPERIARNELYVDIAVEPMKSVEFIYIPIRLKNPGSISGAAATTQIAI